MTDDRPESNEEPEAARLRQWFAEAAQHPVWERPVKDCTRPPEGDGGAS